MSDKPIIDPDELLIWVHTWHGRDELRQPTLASLDASDAAGRYEIMRQPEGVDRDVFYMDTLRDIASRPGIGWMLRLEDDTVVNPHLLHNVCRWGAVHSARFGAGWLSVTREMLKACVAEIDGYHVRDYKECHFAGGVLMRTSLLETLLDRIEHRLTTHPSVRNKDRFAPGCALSHAVYKSGRRVFFHEPAIVAIDLRVPAYHGKKQPAWSQPFSPTYRA